MSKQKFQAIILAAGKSSRFNTSLTKLSFTLCGQELIVYPVKLFSDLCLPVTLVLGYQKDILLSILNNYKLDFSHVEQAEQKGTGHAVLCTRQAWSAENIIIINGDMPLVSTQIITQLIKQHEETQATLTFAISHNSDPALMGYGRVIKENNKIYIQEARDFNGDSRQECCINAGIYIIKRVFLEKTLETLESHANSGEFYITDLIQKACDAKLRVETVIVEFDCVRGINTLKELWATEHIKRAEIITKHMQAGVRFFAPQTVAIDLDVTIGADSTIGQGVQLRKGTIIGQGCSIDAFSIISNSTIADHASIKAHCVLSDAYIGTAAQVGPFAHIRNQSTISQQAVIGNFIEINKTSIGAKTKAKHVSYLGNSEIGSGVNIGAGAITANYNGVTKHTTIIKDNAFIGVNSSLIAPVIIGQGALVAAGSVINQPVPADALAIARSAQINKEKYASKLKEGYKTQKENNNNQATVNNKDISTIAETL